MNDQRLNIGHIGKQREYGKVIYKLLSSLVVSLYFKGEYGTAAPFKIFFIKLVAWLAFKGRMMNRLNLRMF